MSDTVNPFTNVPAHKSLHDAEKTILESHAQQVRSASFQEIVARDSPYEDVPPGGPEGTLFQDLKDWTQESTGEIAKANEAEGKGSSPEQPDWNIAMMSLLESLSLSLRDMSLVRKAALESDDVEATKAKLLQSVENIKELADLWGLNFLVLCDLVDKHPDTDMLLAGPYCCAFYSKNVATPFIVVAFKGTTSHNVMEWITDAKFRAHPPDVKSQLWDAPVSRGVYEALFDNYKSLRNNPFDHIVGVIQVLATRYKATEDKPVPVYVAGHSLGASYSTLFYAELFRRFGVPHMPFNEGARFRPVDLHNYGSPRIALGELAQKLKENLPLGKPPGHVWRIANTNDLVPSVPPFTIFGQNFIHIDGGWRIGNVAPTPLPSEIGTRPPHFKGDVPAHLPGPYYEGIKVAQGRP